MSRSVLSSAFFGVCAIGLAAGMSGGACSANNGTGTFGGGGSHTTGHGASGQGANNTGGDDIGFDAGSGNSGNGGSTTGTACAAEPHQAQQLPLDIYIMLDQSGSMDGTVGSTSDSKWKVVTGAIQAFLTQPGLNGISVGIQYFALPPGGAPVCASQCFTDADCGSTACGPCFGAFPPAFPGICFGGAASADSCAAADYAKPDVPIAPLPGAAAGLLQSIQNHSPSTGTPTAPALQGAIDYAKGWLNTHPGHVVIALLATDGIPESCSPTNQAGIAPIAAAGLANGIKTYAIGVFGDSDTPTGPNLLEAIAQQGGGKAFNFSTNQNNVGQQFLDALNEIRGAALGCQYSIPAPSEGEADYGKVNVQYTPGGGGAPTLFLRYPDKASCPASGDGWYYDDNLNPTVINFCDATCDKVKADNSGLIDVLLGCKSEVPG